jgi:hypothetical protein
VVGKLAGPLLPLLVNHLLTLILFLNILPRQRWETVQMSLAMIPLACVLIATINLLGIWNVIRPRALQQRDALAAGRAMLSVWLFSAMLIPISVLAIVGGMVASMILGENLTAYLTGGALGVCVAVIVQIALITYSFDRWQPSTGEARDEERELNR